MTPSLSTRSLLIESLVTGEKYFRAMAVCVANELEAAEYAMNEGASRRLQRKDYLCDPNATSEYTLCICQDLVSAHMDDDCLDICMDVCSVMSPPWDSICMAGCYASCWVPEYCADWECTVIYPCD